MQGEKRKESLVDSEHFRRRQAPFPCRKRRGRRLLGHDLVCSLKIKVPNPCQGEGGHKEKNARRAFVRRAFSALQLSLFLAPLSFLWQLHFSSRWDKIKVLSNPGASLCRFIKQGRKTLPVKGGTAMGQYEAHRKRSQEPPEGETPHPPGEGGNAAGDAALWG